MGFTVTGFTLPAAMAYTTDTTVPSQVPFISRSSQAAEATVRQLIMQSVEDVLYQQGRSGGLSDDVISLILQQLTVTVNYTPLKCNKVFTMPAAPGNIYDEMNLMNCIITEGTVTNVCIPTAAALAAAATAQQAVANKQKGAVPKPPLCNTGDNNAANLQRVPSENLSISGILTTTNIIMAKWSREMWHRVLNRVVRSLSSSSFASNFNGAIVVIN